MWLVSGVEGLFHYIGSISFFIKDIFWWLFVKKTDFKSVLREVVFIGVNSLPLVSLISFFIGIIIAFQTAYQLKQFSSEIYIASLVALSLVRELGPVIGSLIVAARSGASITAGIGSMKISEQVDALEAFAVEPINYLVVPKFIALLIGGAIAGVILLGGIYIILTKLNMQPPEIVVNMVNATTRTVAQNLVNATTVGL